MLKEFENAENLGGKAWQHSINLDSWNQAVVKDCSITCFHYQQMLELLFKHTLEVKSKLSAYPRSHKLHKLLEAVIELTEFKTDKVKYTPYLNYITVCAEEYRYNFDLDCNDYFEAQNIVDNLFLELISFLKEKKS